MSGRVILSPIMRGHNTEMGMGLSEPQHELVNSIDARISDNSSGHHNVYS